MRNMSFALTTEQVLSKTKTVTRRVGWQFLKAGDLIQPVKKCMGFKKGETIVKIGAPVEIVGIKREPLCDLTANLDYGFSETLLEGFGEDRQCHWPTEFVRMFCNTHNCSSHDSVTRIEFRYIA